MQHMAQGAEPGQGEVAALMDKVQACCLAQGAVPVQGAVPTHYLRQVQNVVPVQSRTWLLTLAKGTLPRPVEAVVPARLQPMLQV
jgi:hypothetical protein